jgi:hypothetical protein
MTEKQQMQAKTRVIRPVAKPPAQEELTPIQQLIADEIGELIMRGGAMEDVDSILWSAVACMERRRLETLRIGEKERDEMITKRVRADFDRMKAELVLSWRGASRPGKPGAQTQSNAAHLRIRAMVIETLRERFECFLSEGTPEEHRLMSDILIDHESSNRGRNAFDELPLGRAFEYQVQAYARDYVRVPGSMREQVEQYIECLKAVDSKGTNAA